MQKKQISENDLFDFDDPMPSGHWAVPWSDLMMVAFVLFAVLYSYVLSHRDIGDALSKPLKKVPTKSTVRTSPGKPQVPPVFSEMNKEVDARGNVSMEELYETLKTTVKVANPDDVSVALDQNKNIKVSVGEPMLFDLGRADLKPGSIDFLEKFAEKIRKTRYKITVEGHTDSFPIHSDYFPTNWELSTMRAIRVARFLIEDAGLEAERFTVAGYSMYKPLAPNSSPQAKAKNRRVEIVITREKIE
jgi:chemotaxis protein MotB